ncbi:hypothetical protein RLO149_c013040 [Roseobacter litoralis Och 149]|uniref:Secreted protein n=1 Tax=Roseobacter litoralis (strain ATCC 49566 / DSM 6996 / JCM 21268 / NBRC 15278 / OCh 149) TaxID=391595 RepID=F7ZD97_ROSLO|nr:hypothetical protein RLO149_c013040 [Roseobacter litoralis Och 149]
MGSLRTCLLIALVALPLARPSAADDALFRVFAECAGRFSAEREHAWLVGDPDADLYDDQRLVFLSLLDATLPRARARDALAHRVDVKMAHASLLRRATFSQHPEHVTRARHLAAAYRKTCLELLLDS